MLDPFLTASRDLKAKILEKANSLADDEDDIAIEDRRHVIFCPIRDLEVILSASTEDNFLMMLNAARQKKYAGWELSQISQAEGTENERANWKKFPFNLDGLLPWWARLQDQSDEAARLLTEP